MPHIDFMSVLHKSTQRDYLARVNDADYPKAKASELAKKWDFDYWDGDRRICYGGYRYMEGRWEKVARALAEHYNIKPGDKILDVGCGKGFLLYDFTKVVPGVEVYGLDISGYAIANSKEEIRDRLQVGSATSLPFADNYFDLVISINTLHNLHNYELELALREIERVGKENKYICVESYRNEAEKANLLYWQVTCESFCTPREWQWWFELTGYTGDYSFIYFE
ncbi:class I SAM-dependent methyltransferase [Aquicella lusitana]|uniref:Protein-L-isoaspartate(D-aspartate) O-methyltransferase n=1 Tax=Aquicella lusitana TaxID=254246 RepID=A0A370GWW7_9COXI|nr:class I SAM-dependent methyltransferase [Aquicella lusitana]RDI48157.1 protein-L-isoaspartate(D-aspartate) O-methyltransferase [Aquicella lusitana]VVC72827.1 23S rRNA (guanine(745)-N(1))-methyltransferase [Aquicella lusitana]